VPNKGLDIEVLSIILNSGVCRFYIEAISNAISGGFFAYQKSQISSFTIPDLDEGQVKELKALKTPQKVNGFLAKVYGIELPEEYLNT
jgi:hypothetical protein